MPLKGWTVDSAGFVVKAPWPFCENRVIDSSRTTDKASLLAP